MDQHLLPPYAPTTMDLKTPTGKLPVRFHPLAPKSTTPFQHADENRSDRCSGGLCRTVVLCVLALAVCGGFVLLYLQMRNLEQQVLELRELTYQGGSYGPFDDDETEAGWTSHSKSDNHGNKNRDRLPDIPEWNHDGDDSTQHEGHTRERRSTNGGSLSPRGHVSGSGVHQGEPSAHVIPLNTMRQDDFYHRSSWFTWTDQVARVSHASIPLHSTGKYLLAPHAGYYYIYSQVTIMACDNGTSEINSRGHSLYVKTLCGQEDGQELTHYVTTPYNRNAGCTYDSGYIGGVYYLERGDHVGVKPYMPLGFLQSRVFLKPYDSYFGMFLIRKIPGARRRCSFSSY